MSSETAAVDEATGPVRQGFLFNVNLVFAMNIALYLLSFAVNVSIARLLGPDGKGATSLFQTAVTVTYAFLSMGVATSAVYFVSRSDITPRRAGESGLTITVFALVAGLIGVAIVAPFAGHRLLEAHVPYWFILLAIPAAIQFRVVEGIIRAQERFFAMSVLELSLPISNLIALLGVELLFGLTISRAIACISVTTLVPLVIGYAYIGPAAWPRRLDLGIHLRQMVRFGLRGQVGNLVQLLNYRLDSYLVLAFVNTAGVGLYAVGVSMSEALWFVANSVSTVLVPRLSASDDISAASMTPIISRNTITITAVGAAFVALLSSVLIPLFFGSAFHGAIRPMLWLLPGTVTLSAAKILSSYVFSRGRPDINSWISGFSLVVTIVFDLTLIPTMGVTGAAIASSIAYSANLVMTAIAYRRLSGQPIAAALLPTLADRALYVEGARSLLSRLPIARSALGPRAGSNT